MLTLETTNVIACHCEAIPADQGNTWDQEGTGS